MVSLVVVSFLSRSGRVSSSLLCFSGIAVDDATLFWLLKSNVCRFTGINSITFVFSTLTAVLLSSCNRCIF